MRFLLLISVLLCPYVAFSESLISQYQIPPLQRANPQDLIAAKILQQARALKRAEQVSVGFSQIEDVETYTKNLRQSIQIKLPTCSDNQQVFAGTRSSELQAVLDSLQVPQTLVLQAPRIEVDQVLTVPSDVCIQGRNARFVAPPEFVDAVFYFPATTRNASLAHLVIEAEQSIHLRAAQQIRLQHIEFIGGRGVAVLTGSRYIELAHLRMQQARQGAVMLQGDVSEVWLHHNQFVDSQRADNGGAAVLLTDALNKPTIEEHAAHYVLTEAIWPLAPAPHAVLLEHNDLSHNRAQALYLDGAYGIVVQNNVINHNDKEGMCLDFGAVNNIVRDNSVAYNGNRARQTDEDLKQDWVLDFGRMADGSAISKLPGIALDNAAQNIIMSNNVRDNAGDGIKIVRSGFRNLFLFNSILNNNTGTNQTFQFFGVLLGSAGIEQALSGEDMSNHPLDFLPPLENIVAGNTIYGAHRAGILLDRDAIFNDVYDNQVRHFRIAPFESASSYFNSVVGNNWQPEIQPTDPAQLTAKPMLWLALLLGLGLTLLVAWFAMKHRKT